MRWGIACSHDRNVDPACAIRPHECLTKPSQFGQKRLAERSPLHRHVRVLSLIFEELLWSMLLVDVLWCLAENYGIAIQR
jgi:hypothetical protein